jgi:integrase
MTRRKRLTDDGVADLKPRASRHAHPDPECPGHYIRVTPRGAKSYVAVALDPNGKQVWHTLGSVSEFKSIADARVKAREVIGHIVRGEDRGGPQSFAKVANDWFARHVEKSGLRSASEIRRYLDQWLLPAWSGRDFESIKRGDVSKLLDHVEDNAGPVAADKALSIVSRITTWHAARNDNYASPIVKGMRRTSVKDRARTRILSDDELRAVWRQAESNGVFGVLIRLLLLTAQRKDKVATMCWEDISEDGVWTIPSERREKGNAQELKLPAMALDIINAQQRFGNNAYVLAGSKPHTHNTGNSRSKRTFDAKLRAAGHDLPQWQLHDLRRTARSLMSRAGVRPDVAERVLGHAIVGVQGVYDRFNYTAEKADALACLAGLIDSIINGGKVRKLRA